MNRLMHRGWLPLVLLLGPVLVGCQQAGMAQQGPPAPPTPEVEVAAAVSRYVTDYEDFPGRTEAVSSIEVRARVNGYLDRVNFVEGAEVKQGDVLFEIDPRPYQAELNRTDAAMVQAQAHCKRMEADYQRAVSLFPKGSISRQEYDQAIGDRDEATAAIGVAKAAREMAALNLSFTKVQAPISGRISRRFKDPGNLIKADDTLLTTIVSLDPIYAYFDVDERTTLRVQQLVRDGTIKWNQEVGLPVMIGLPTEEGYSLSGTINFADNRVDPDTGTWRLRATVHNSLGILTPGLFVRMRLPIGAPYQATLVAEKALGTDQGQKFLYVVKDNKVEYRRIKVGRLHDGLRVIKDSQKPNETVKPGETVIVTGLQRVRDKSDVKIKMRDMLEVAEAEGANVSALKAEGNTQGSR